LANRSIDLRDYAPLSQLIDRSVDLMEIVVVARHQISEIVISCRVVFRGYERSGARLEKANGSGGH
jgi:hypothetical protein